jgi:hypothetical protein
MNAPCAIRHPEVRAERASKDAAEAPTEIGLSDFGMLKVSKSATADLEAVALRGSAVRAEHLRVTEKKLAERGFGLVNHRPRICTAN